MGHLIIPNAYIAELNKPLIFLAGPIINAPHWHDEAIKFLFAQKSDIMIASPRRELKDELVQYVISGENNHFPRQRAWELYYLEHAAKKGCVLFWLPGEEAHDRDKVYSAMTRVELGETMMVYKYDKHTNFCIGTDGKFPEFSPIKYDLSIFAPDKEIKTTLQDTCREALRIVSDFSS